MILHPEFLAHTEYLKPTYFANIENSCYFWGIQELYKAGISTIDAYNLSTVLKGHKGVKKTLEKYNFPSVKDAIDLYVQVARNSLQEYESLVKMVLTLAFKRELVPALEKIKTTCFDPQIDLENLSNSAYGELDGLTQRFITNGELSTIGGSVDDLWEEIVNRRNPDGTFGIPSRFPTLGTHYVYEKGELVVVVSAGKGGKSTYLMNEAIHKIKLGLPTLYVDTEMAATPFFVRMLAHLTGIDSKRIRSGNYTDEEGDRISMARKWLKEQPLVYKYATDLSENTLYSYCHALKSQIGLSFVVFDYIKSNAKTTSENYNILGQKVDFLKNKIAGKLELPVLTAAQLNRDGTDVADSKKIKDYLSVGIKLGTKTQDMIARDGIECGNRYAQVFVTRHDEAMTDEDDYVDLNFNGNTSTITEATQHIRESDF